MKIKIKVRKLEKNKPNIKFLKNKTIIKRGQVVRKIVQTNLLQN